MTSLGDMMARTQNEILGDRAGVQLEIVISTELSCEALKKNKFSKGKLLIEKNTY